jgi:hypothetical protein
MWGIVRTAPFRHLLHRPRMSATPLNARALPRMTRSLILALSMALLAAATLAFVLGGPAARQELSAADRPVFIRRIDALPAVVVTVPQR